MDKPINEHQVSRAKMIELFGFPYFGYTRNYGGYSEVWLLKDLPSRVVAAVKAHEYQHVTDNAFLDGRVWHWEARAWWAGFRADWRGFFQGVWMSITDRDRLRLYWQRITQKF